jgi:hypothetical protein
MEFGVLDLITNRLTTRTVAEGSKLKEVSTYRHAARMCTEYFGEETSLKADKLNRNLKTKKN